MKALIVYDSMFGNTEKIAQSIHDSLAESVNVEILHMSKLNSKELNGLDLVIVGSPTHRCKPSESVNVFLNNIPRGALKGISIASFDTRYHMSKWLLWLAGSATKRIARKLKSKKGNLALEPESFIVTGREGPLEDGELERASLWAKTIIEAHNTSTNAIKKRNRRR